MSTVLEQCNLPEARRRWSPWLAVAVGLLALYVPTVIGLARTLWREEEYAHGPIILAIVLFLFWRGRNEFRVTAGRQQVAGGFLLLAGLALYTLEYVLRLV